MLCFPESILTVLRTMTLGRFAGPIWTIILIMSCLFFDFLEWYLPRDELDYVECDWDNDAFREVFRVPPSLTHQL